jgi:hypothetical protein
VRHRNQRAKSKGFRGLEIISFGATKPTIDTANSSSFASSMPNRDELDVVGEYLTLAESQSRPLESSSFRFP